MAETKVDALLDDAPWTPTHLRIWILSSMGILLDGFDFFIMGVAIPLIAQEWHPSSWETGLLGAAAVLGAIVGASTLGALGDRLGRRMAFRLDLGMFVVFALASALAPGLWWLIGFRFLLGVGIGADYPLSAAYVSEIAPARIRTRLLVGAFSFQAVGQVLGVVVGLVILHLDPTFGAWRPMLAFGVVPAVAIVWFRRTVPESPRWLASSGHPEEAAAVVSRLCARPVTPEELREEPGTEPPTPLRWRELLSRPFRAATALTSVPWLLMDIATYGIGVFTPTIIAAIVVPATAAGVSQYIADDLTSTKGAAFCDVFLVVGFLLAIWLVPKVGKIPLQVLGFVVMAVALVVLAAVAGPTGAGSADFAIVFVGFAGFNLFMNLGPNSTTFVMPAEVFPTRVRGSGAGFAAAAGKTGAALGTFLFPILQDDLGLDRTLVIIALGCAVAAAITFGLRATAARPPAADAAVRAREGSAPSR